MAGSAAPLRVLVVDDHPDVTMSLAALMRLEHFDVEVAGDGFVGLEKATATLPHAVVLDINMPGMSGYELARHLRNLPRGEKLFIVAITGCRITDADRLIALESGIDRHFSKPTEPFKLMSLLKQSCAANG